jgi:hypothetical protein
MSSTTNTGSAEPICTAVLLDMEAVDTAEALQQQLNVPLLSHRAGDNEDSDAHGAQSRGVRKICRYEATSGRLAK